MIISSSSSSICLFVTSYHSILSLGAAASNNSRIYSLLVIIYEVLKTVIITIIT